MISTCFSHISVFQRRCAAGGCARLGLTLSPADYPCTLSLSGCEQSFAFYLRGCQESECRIFSHGPGSGGRGDCMARLAVAAREKCFTGGCPGKHSYYISVYLSIYVYQYVRLSMYICMYACMHVCIYLYPCIYHSIGLWVNPGSRYTQSSTYSISVYLSIYTYLSFCLCMFVRTYVCIYLSISKHLYTYI